MTKKIFYEKRGRRYIPVAEYDQEYLDSFPKGNHLVMCYPGGQSRRFHINPNHAAMIAAARVAEDTICSTIIKASELKPTRTPLTEEQIKAWNAMKEAFDDEMIGLRGVSIHDCVEAGIQAMIREAEKNMEKPAVKQAYEHFLLVSELSK